MVTSFFFLSVAPVFSCSPGGEEWLCISLMSWTHWSHSPASASLQDPNSASPLLLKVVEGIHLLCFLDSFILCLILCSSLVLFSSILDILVGIWMGFFRFVIIFHPVCNFPFLFWTRSHHFCSGAWEGHNYYIHFLGLVWGGSCSPDLQYLSFKECFTVINNSDIKLHILHLLLLMHLYAVLYEMTFAVKLVLVILVLEPSLTNLSSCFSYVLVEFDVSYVFLSSFFLFFIFISSAVFFISSVSFPSHDMHQDSYTRLLLVQHLTLPFSNLCFVQHCQKPSRPWFSLLQG